MSIVSISPESESRLLSIVIYVAETSDLNAAELVVILERISKETTEKAMTLIERTFNEGRNEGRSESRIETTIQHIGGLLRMEMTAETIATAFQMPVAEVRAIIQKIQAQGNAPQS